MTYSKTVWQNNNAPPLNATNLNKIENALEAHDTGISNLNTEVTDLHTPAEGMTVPTGGYSTAGDAVRGQISELKSQIVQSTGMSADFKVALENLLQYVVYKGDDPTGRTYLTALHNAMYPPAQLTSITAVYTQSGTVYDTDSLDDLKADLVVTAHFDDSSTETVTTYTLSGELSQNPSTITVSYGDKTTTFSVNVVIPVFDYDSQRDGLLSEKEGITVYSSATSYYSETLTSSNNLRVQGKVSGQSNYLQYKIGDNPVTGTWRMRIRAELYTLTETTGARCFRPQISNGTNGLRIGCHSYNGGARFASIVGTNTNGTNIFSGITTGDVWHDFELYCNSDEDVWTVSVDGVEKYRTTSSNIGTGVKNNSLFITGQCLIFIRSIKLYSE